ncbi:MAG: sugar transferase, partial [Acidimicrobiia bacterium]
MAVASQTAPPSLHAAKREPVARIERVAASSRHRAWISTGVVVGGDALALVAAALLVAEGSVYAALYVPLALLVLAVSGAYHRRLSLRALDLAPWIATRLAVPLLVLGPIAAIAGADAGALLTTAVVAVALVVPERVVSFAVLRRIRRRGHLLEPAVILGAGEVGAELGRAFLEYPEYGVDPVGFLDCVDGNLPAPLLGDVDQLPRLLDEHREIRRVVVAFGPAQESELVSVLRTAVMFDVEVSVVPRFFDNGVAPEGPDTDDVRGVPLYRVRQSALRKPAWVLKRGLDIVVAGTALVLAAPLLAMFAILVKLSSPGPVLFRQGRVGQRGREIMVSKFRTLKVNHDSDTQWSVDDDPRVTWVGRILRRTSIDELPQLWSVLKGDMSLVGPRPERPLFVKRFSAPKRAIDQSERKPYPRRRPPLCLFSASTTSIAGAYP